MKVDSNIKKVLLLGSGALKIGQAGEFDYSGSQAIKALKEEGVNVILINPNIATVQTSWGFADKVYFLPIEPHFVEKIIEMEKPDGILLSFGGQTALNCGVELSRKNILQKHKVEVMGTPIVSIEKTEDRRLFAETLSGLGLLTPESRAVKTVREAVLATRSIGFPLMIRGAYSLGGQDSGVVNNKQQLIDLANRALSKSPQILIEEYLSGWKEIEYEVVRDKFDNCITVCNMENVDPMGIHTGESIVVAPSQTLNNFEYHGLREIAIKVIRDLGIIGECNIQFALNPRPQISNFKLINSEKIANSQLDYRIIEVNARLSRSSALASKATGYPLAYIAAKLALGKNLADLKNSVTQKTTAAFEPALDYLVVKFPRWDFSKFLKSDHEIGTSMQSVGEVMAIGRKFEEALQKAIRMLDIGFEGVLDEKIPNVSWEKPTPWRIFAIAQAIKNKVPIDKIHKQSKIDQFFLEKIKKIVSLENSTKKYSLDELKQNELKILKQYGFSDKRIGDLFNTSEHEIRKIREKLSIHPSFKQIDTLAGEYPSATNYLYLTYNGEGDDIKISERSIVVLGSGPYRIGSSVEFDWCSVRCAQTVTENNFQVTIINCNPETVSTDYDMADKLFFEELTAETVLEICRKEQPYGVIISMGGQTPNNLATELASAKVKILGTSSISIDKAENRSKFSNLCDNLKIDQPVWANLVNINSAISFAKKIGYPVLVRPSYVLSGAAMNVAFSADDLKQYLKLASLVSPKYPVVISKYFQDAKEVEIDAVSQRGEIICFAITEHVENAGVHSGDSTVVLPAQNLNAQTLNQIKSIAQKIARALKITGPFNIQFLAIKNKVMVIECNLRASRSLPFVSKVLGVDFAKAATEAIIDRKLKIKNKELKIRNYVAVKSPQFSFSRIKGADPILRVEMSSTGEVASFGDDIYEAFLKSLIATGVTLPKKSVFISLAGDENKIKFLESAKKLAMLGLKLYATEGTSKFLRSHGIKSHKLFKIHERKTPNVLKYLNKKKVDLVINIFDPYFKKEFDDDYLIRRTTIDFGIPILTNMQTAQLFVDAISIKKLEDLKALPWNYYVKNI